MRETMNRQVTEFWTRSFLARNVLAATALMLCFMPLAPVTAQVSLRVMNPRGETPPPPVLGLQQRLVDLNGKRVALLENGKLGASVFFDAVEEQLKQHYPNVTVLRIPKPQGSRFAFDAKEWYPEVASRADAFLYGMGD